MVHAELHCPAGASLVAGPMRFTWNPAKNEANTRKNGISFGDVLPMFDAVTVEHDDDRLPHGEIRVRATGLVTALRSQW